MRVFWDRLGLAGWEGVTPVRSPLGSARFGLEGSACQTSSVPDKQCGGVFMACTVLGLVAGAGQNLRLGSARFGLRRSAGASPRRPQPFRL